MSRKEVFRPGADTYNLAKDPIISKAWERMHKKDQNLIMGISGQTGSGKSGCGITFAIMLDVSRSGYTRWYNEDKDGNIELPKLVFSAEDFLKLVQQGAKDLENGVKNPVLNVGSVIIWDEAGVGNDATEHMSQKSKIIKHILQTYRYMNLGLIMTVPDIVSISKSTRRLMHCNMHVYADVPDGYDRNKMRKTRFKWIAHNKDDLRMYNQVYIDLNKRNRMVKIIDYFVAKPPQKVLDAYQKKKEEFTVNLYDTAEQDLNMLSDKRNDKIRNNKRAIMLEVLSNKDDYLASNGKFSATAIELSLDARPTMAKKIASFLNIKNNNGKIDELYDKLIETK